jgi:hypothetical protein
MAYNMRYMEFIETPTFTRQVTQLLTDDAYRQIQNVLVENPAQGALIKGGGGIRKLRHAVAGKGKSGRGSNDLLLGQRRSSDLHAGRLSQIQEG